MLRRPLAVHALTSTAFDGALKTKDMTATVTAADLAAAEVELTSDEQDLVQVLVVGVHPQPLRDRQTAFCTDPNGSIVVYMCM